MKNPNGPYPGRQLFVGTTASGKPAFAYLVTGRSPASRERKATKKGNGVIMGPIGNQPYDPLRHYTAVKYDNEIGLLVVSNGIQTDAVFETYKLLYHTASDIEKTYAGAIMTGAKYEPDSLHTPRITGVIANPAGKPEPAYFLSIVTDIPPAKTYVVKPAPGILTGVATYKGDMAKPEKFNVRGKLPAIKCKAETPGALARYLYDISAETNEGDDIRVCAVAGVRTGNEWKLAMINRHKE